jgi:hypothetical protein
MAIELATRLLAVIAAVAFTSVLSGRQLPIIPTGRWTVAALFALGLALCTVAGMRDDLGTGSAQPEWLVTTLSIFGISAGIALLAVLVGANWRAGVLALAAVTTASWVLTFAYAMYAGLGTAVSGAATLIVAVGVSMAAWRIPSGRPNHVAHAAS